MTYTDTLEEFHWAMRLCATLNGNKKTHPLDEYANTLQYLLENEHSPETVWDFLDNGSYKEVYVPFHKAPFVIKFCAVDNNTEAEEMVIAEATAHHLSQFFVPTYFINLPVTLPAAYLDDVCEYSSKTSNYTYSAQTLNAIEVQPRIRVFEASCLYGKALDVAWEKVAYFHDSTGVNVDPDIVSRLRRFIPYADFVQQMYQYYTNKEMANLVEFMEEFDISDLHGSNLGFMKEDGRPVILDWMSR